MASNLRRHSQRKKQTRLAFDPVEPSSSATMSPARIRYQPPSSPPKAFDLASPARITDNAEDEAFPSGKNYAIVVETPKKRNKDGRLPFKPITKQVGSSQTQRGTLDSSVIVYSGADYSDSDLEIVSAFRRQRAPQPSKSSSPYRLLPVSNIHSDASRPLGGAHKFMSGDKNRQPMAYNGAGDDSSAGSSPEEEEQAIRNKARQAKPRRKPVTLPSIALSDDDSEVESPLESPTRVSMMRDQAVLPKTKSLANMDGPKSVDTRSLISGGTINFAQKKKKTPQKQKLEHQGSSSNSSSREGAKETDEFVARSDDEDSIAILPTPQRTGRRGASKRQSTVIDESEDIDVEPQSSQMRSRRTTNATVEDVSEDDLPSVLRTTAPSVPNRKVARAFQDGDKEDEDAIVRTSPKRRLRKQVERVNEEHDTADDDEEPISSPLKRRRMVVQSDTESDPLTSPLKRFRPGPIGQKVAKIKAIGQSKRITRQQQQKRPHRSAREKKLELLRRQRAGEKIVELTSSESDDRGSRHGLYDSNSELEVLSEFEDEENGDNGGFKKVHHSFSQSNQNDDDEFIVDDDDDPLGVPDIGLHDIPLQFTHHAHKPLKEHFKDAVEWMIQNKVNPAFNRKDPIYVQAFRKLDMEVQGYATSIYSSTVWKEAFTRALWARPVFLESAITPGDENEGTKCDACGRTNHPATFEVQFGGKAYHKDTLDEVDNDSGGDEDEDEDDEDDDSSSNASVNSSGQPIPGMDVSWFVGRFCKANAQTAHSLIHWKHALNDWVIDRLKSDGHLAAQKLAEREDWSKKRRSEYANRIVDEWEDEGEVKALYRDFKNNLDVARQGKLTRRSN